ncbi:MAG: dienelactone hydrolase family protein [Actinomycetota bacterium]|jgi:dienelactone hydrolase|nr:dienelactone hydrolase family protein [Actinomycetota bacterium]MDA3014560.1 dienelactone hydrolase family protein [Actinomycetota bacterium]MDA3027993.1 dienelactone hydrolase family protein [Actinomycetota bacterium]
MSALAGWTSHSFTAAGFTHDWYRRGSGPAVIVIHEIPGITPKVLRFAEEVVERGFTVAMPDLVGVAGRGPSKGYLASSFAKVCVSREFSTWAVGKTSPVVGWLRALGRHLHAEVGGPGIGAVGMCFSGGFALGMMVDETMVAPVLSQPSLPLPAGDRRGVDLGLDPADLAVVVERASQGCQVLGLRFTDDRAVGTRFDTLRNLLGEAFIAVELPSSSPSDHSVLTEQRDDASVEKVLDFLSARLLGDGAGLG